VGKSSGLSPPPWRTTGDRNEEKKQTKGKKKEKKKANQHARRGQSGGLDGRGGRGLLLCVTVGLALKGAEHLAGLLGALLDGILSQG